jgi:hypothetical protein
LARRSTDQDGKQDYSPDKVEQFNPPTLDDGFVAQIKTGPDLISESTSNLLNMMFFDASLPLLC